jgi:hypothetical protein
MAAWEIPGSRFARSGLRPTSTSLAPPHVRVGYFHCKEQARNSGPLVSATGSLYRILACRSVARLRAPARPPGRIPALAFLKLHGCGLLYFPVFSANTTNPRRAAAACVRATKKPGAVSRPGGWRTFDEYAFLEDSRYASQEDSEGNSMRRSFLRLHRGIGRSAWKALGPTQEEEVRLKSAYKDQSEIICSA